MTYLENALMGFVGLGFIWLLWPKHGMTPVYTVARDDDRASVS